ncbi:MAG: RNA polymerase sigma factor [Candidatus Saccharimonadales bacterium]
MNDWDITLVTEAQSGNTKCFEELYELYHKKVFAVIRTTVKNRADAEDILQQTFLAAWRNLKNLSNPAAFNTWIQRIAINQCYELLRKKNIAILLDSENELDNMVDDAPDDLIPAVYAEREDLRIRLGRILEDLSEVQRQTITFYYFNELKVEEIAEIMECSANTVKTRLFLARKTIKNEIEEQERKTGQKFYGIAGIPMLALSQILAQQVEAASLSTAASNSILGSITSTIASEAAVAAQVAAEAGSMASNATSAASATTSATAAGTAAKASIPLATKIIAGVVVAGLIAAGIFILPPLLSTEEIPPSVITDESSLDGHPSENTSEESTPEASFYDSLSDEQRQLLSELEAALRASDYEVAYGIQGSSEFHSLCDEIPDWGGFRYYPDEETSALVYRGDSGTYEMSLYIGNNGNGSYRLGRYAPDEDILYSLSETNYSGGSANGAFITYFYFREDNGEILPYRFEGDLVDGIAQEPVNVYKEGEPFGNSRPESHSWWPQWPEE